MPGHSLPSGERERLDQEFLWLQKRTFLVKCGLTRGVISSGAGANRRVAFSGNAGIKTGSGLRIDKHRLDRARSGNFRRHAQYPQYMACSRPVATQLEDYSGSCVPAGRCRPKH